MVMILMAAAALLMSGEAEKLVDGRVCSFEEPSNKTLRQYDPPAGVTLLPGYLSGMSKAEVKALSRDLMSSEPRGWFEFAPGVRGRATANFSKKGNVLESINLRGYNPTETYAALVRDLGEPDLRKLLGTIKDVQIRGPGSVGGWTERVPKEETLKWCRGPRDIQLWLNENDFWIRVTPVYSIPDHRKATY